MLVEIYHTRSLPRVKLLILSVSAVDNQTVDYLLTYLLTYNQGCRGRF